MALLLTAENEKDSVEKTLSMTIYVLREAGSCSQHVGSAAVHNSFSPSLVSLPFSAFEKATDLSTRAEFSVLGPLKHLQGARCTL